MTCAQVKSQHVCKLVAKHLLPDLCHCACPPSTGRRTQAVSYAGGATCKLTEFDAKLSNLNKYCCDPKDPDDKCTGGVPQYWCVPPFVVVHPRRVAFLPRGLLAALSLSLSLSLATTAVTSRLAAASQ